MWPQYKSEFWLHFNNRRKQDLPLSETELCLYETSVQNSLCDFEHPEQSKRPESRETEAAGPLVEMNPEHLENGTGTESNLVRN